MASFTREEPAPRILRVALGAGPEGLEVGRAALDAAPGASARLGGAALAVHLVGLEDERDSALAASALVLTVGSAVRRGLPTAARLTVAGRSPLTGGYSEGQVGGELAAALAGHADALVLTGRAPDGANVLVLDADGALRLERRPELTGLAPERVGAELAPSVANPARSGLLAIGPAGESGVSFAGLSSGWSEPSFTGRGGLGARFGGLGLKALVVEPARTAESEALDPRSAELAALLAGSPRLAQRAASGTLELLHAYSARGDLRAHNHRDALDTAAGSALEREARELATGRHGCRGCPTPCGLVFDRPRSDRAARGDSAAVDSARGRAHFGAIYALGPNLGLENFEAALQLHALCDAAGMDAREVGAVLALAARARELGHSSGPPLWGDGAALAELLGELARGTEVGAPFAEGAAGAVRYAKALGLEAELIAARGQAARPERHPAAVLGQVVATAGSDPVRAFPFLSEAGVRAPGAGLSGLVGLESLPPGAEDPETPTGKGLLVWWHENLAAALDSLGFCAFSAGGLLADGLSGLEELAALLLREPQGAAQGDAELLLAHGAAVVLARRELELRWSGDGQSPPAWAAADLAHPELLPAYLSARGPVDGSVRAGALAEAPSRALAHPRSVVMQSESPVAPRSPSRGAGERRTEQCPGRVELRSAGVLADRLGSPRAVELALPATAGDALVAAGRAVPAADGLLWREGQLLPLVYRDGQRLEVHTEVRDGDCLDLVLTVAGG